MKSIIPFIFQVVSFSQACARSNDFQNEIQILASNSDGRVGICIFNFSDIEPTCVNGDQRFQLQSVMKLIVAAAIMDAADQNRLKLNDKLIVLPSDASPGPQDFANLVRKLGRFETTIEDLIRRAVIDSDSTSVDILLKHVGGPGVVQKFLEQYKFGGIRLDRNERQVQADSVGLQWHDSYADFQKFEDAANALTEDVRSKAWAANLIDPRDTATPVGMVNFLKALATYQILSKESSNLLIDMMKVTLTGPGRLMAGTPKNWRLAHKTGTGRTWKNVNAATNDVGILFAPDGGKIAIATFVAESSQESGTRDEVIANAARIVTEHYKTKILKKRP